MKLTQIKLVLQDANYYDSEACDYSENVIIFQLCLHISDPGRISCTLSISIAVNLLAKRLSLRC